MERNTHPADANGEFHNRDGTPSPMEPNEASNQPATTSLVLGILAVVIQLLAWGVWIFWRDKRLPPSSASLRGGTLLRSRPIARGSGSCSPSPLPWVSAPSCSA
jgi:hypothetical protein